MGPTGRWKLAWTLGGVVVAIAAGLLITIIALARRIVGQAGDIEDAVAAARRNTAPLFDLTAVNLNLDRIGRELRAMRGRA